MRRAILATFGVAALAVPMAAARAQWNDDAQKCAETTNAPDLAIHHCTKAINSGQLSNENLTITLFNRGVSWEIKRDYDKALEDYNAANRVNPAYVRAYRGRCSVYLAKREYDRALTDCNEAIRLDPNDANAFLNRANVYFNTKDYDRALPDFDAAIRLRPDYAVAHRDRADIWYVKGEYDRAIQGFDEAIRLDPKDATAFYWRGDAWFFKSAFERAIADYDASIAVNPNNASVYEIRGLTRLFLGQSPAAAADFAKSLELGASAWRAALLYLARAGMGRGGPVEAKAELERNAAKLTDTRWPHPIVLFHLGSQNEAALLAAADVDPDQRASRRCAAQYHIGKRMLIAGNKTGARAAFLAAQESCPNGNSYRPGLAAELARLVK